MSTFAPAKLYLFIFFFHAGVVTDCSKEAFQDSIVFKTKKNATAFTLTATSSFEKQCYFLETKMLMYDPWNTSYQTCEQCRALQINPDNVHKNGIVLYLF